ncbi:MAG: hypothetical protein V4537_10765 [Pseudomonadota bacterium]
MTDTVRTQASEMTRTTDRTLAATFGWTTAEERLYRDCPTAFWLAPDGDGVLPPVDGPSLPPPVASVEAPASVAGHGVGMGQAMLAAGPIFTAAAIITVPMGEDLGQRMGLLFGSLVAMPLTMLVGIVLGCLPILLGTGILAWRGLHDPLARERWLWAATGGGMGLAIAGLFDAQVVTVPLVLASAACATIAHRPIEWIDPEPA